MNASGPADPGGEGEPRASWWRTLSPGVLAAGALIATAGAGFVAGMATQRILTFGTIARGRQAIVVHTVPGSEPAVVAFSEDSAARALQVAGDALQAASDARRADAERRMVDQQFARDYALTREQSARIDSILRRRHAALESLRVEIEPLTRALVLRTRVELDSALTTSQRQRFDARWRAIEPEAPPSLPSPSSPPSLSSPPRVPSVPSVPSVQPPGTPPPAPPSQP